jgi:hypothetical protein
LFAKVSTTKNEWARSEQPFHLVEAPPPKDGALRNPSRSAATQALDFQEFVATCASLLEKHSVGLHRVVISLNPKT